jgi:hypothetical protein
VLVGAPRHAGQDVVPRILQTALVLGGAGVAPLSRRKPDAAASASGNYVNEETGAEEERISSEELFKVYLRAAPRQRRRPRMRCASSAPCSAWDGADPRSSASATRASAAISAKVQKNPERPEQPGTWNATFEERPVCSGSNPEHKQDPEHNMSLKILLCSTCSGVFRVFKSFDFGKIRRVREEGQDAMGYRRLAAAQAARGRDDAEAVGTKLVASSPIPGIYLNNARGTRHQPDCAASG